MKKFLLFFIVSILSVSLFAQRDKNIEKAKIELARYGDLYFYFPITKTNNLETIPSFVSIDNLKNGIIYAYINERDFEEFVNFEIPFTVIKKSKDLKSLTMAKTVAEMLDWNRYPTHDVYLQMMHNFATNYPNICKLDTIGFSQNNRPILAVKISDHPDVENDKPQFFYTGQMHGDELVDYILFLRLINYLTSNYGTDDQVTNLINNLEIWINPLSNPDGTYHRSDNDVSGASRYLDNGVDQNRNFPNPLLGEHPDGNDWAKETILMMNFAENHRFVMSANTHSGAEVVNYPWDSWTSSANKHADDDWWQFVSLAYANSAISNSPDGYLTGVSKNGISNGGDWYVCYGSRQDYINHYKHCREFTLELSNSKLLSSDELPHYWDYNRQAMLDYMQECSYGIIGKVTDANTGNPVEAKVEIDNHDKDNSFVYSNTSFGSYYRPIYKGTYSLTFSAPNYQTYHVTNVSVENNDTTILNIKFIPITNHSPEILDSVGHSADTLPLNVYKDSSISVKLNAYDEDGDNLDVNHGISLFQNGGVNIYPYNDTSFVYTPNLGFVGDDLLQIVVNDDGSPVLTDTVYYKVTVVENSFINQFPKIFTSFRVYPNPVSQKAILNFQLTKSGKLEIEIYNILGKKIISYKIGKLPMGDNNFNIDVNSLEKGLYIFRIISDDFSIDKKVIKM
ncbi:MAG: T9SS type A sorting domain-containing protein [Bacteroidetes bacterium]|nr:T9SS type A sorting domain-containing protein [Bacteroidota bacterium]